MKPVDPKRVDKVNKIYNTNLKARLHACTVITIGIIYILNLASYIIIIISWHRHRGMKQVA